jgi:hypothetical protein
MSESEESKSEDLSSYGRPSQTYRGSYDFTSGSPIRFSSDVGGKTPMVRFSPSNFDSKRPSPRKNSSRGFYDEEQSSSSRLIRRVKSDHGRTDNKRNDESGFLDRAFESAANIGDDLSWFSFRLEIFGK